MMKKYLGIICLLYFGIFGYVILFDKLKNFLAPTMQLYIKLSVVPLLIIGLVILFGKNIHYKFKVSDLVLIIPLIFLILAGDGRLTSSFASNRTTNLKNENRIKTEEKSVIIDSNESVELEEKTEITNDNYDFLNPYFEIVDENYSELANYITGIQKASKFKGKTIKVKGFALKEVAFMNNDYFAIGKYEISCCAADAGYTGFIAKYDTDKIDSDKWYEIEGILEQGKDIDGYDIMYINVINIKEIVSSEEEQYVYPCYTYGENVCQELLKYDLEY